MLKPALLPLLLTTTLGLGGCIFERPVGGSCTYLTLQAVAVVTGVTDSAVVLYLPELERSVDSRTLLTEPPPAVGDHLRVAVRQITEGSCTPLMVQPLPVEDE
ncbi:hypothetical protein [Halioxenophilus sp. WMMB6]|uniref:hypothetical protein n=1 Tax=Halioxenophilus sp. WMMB6 TaxID=3073815 RepID=UPI00295EE963|nr:hypothetical protein [Halioxenophilus sp. WMMB6]